MGLKGYRLWVMGQLDSTCRAPPRAGRRASQRASQREARRLPHCSAAGCILKGEL
jgi:hypothetical protein